LVLHTSAAALTEITGVDFLDRGNRDTPREAVQFYHHAFPVSGRAMPKLLKNVSLWRFSMYALKYLRRPNACKVPRGEYDEKNLEKMEELRKKSQGEVERLVRYWEEWVERRELGTAMANLMGEGIEEAYQEVRRRKWEIVTEWKKREEETTRDNKAADMIQTKNEDENGTQGQSKSHKEEPSIDRPRPSNSDSLAKPSNTIHSTPLRSSQGLLTKHSDGFTLTSGILMWSQLRPIYYGSTVPTTSLTGNAASTPPMLPGGTIKQHVYTYKSAARTGRWKVRRAYSNWNGYPGYDGEPTRQLGWVFCHEDVDPLEVIKRCRVISQGFGGISNGNGHIDKVLHGTYRLDEETQILTLVVR
jgi:hypothetical protein